MSTTRKDRQILGAQRRERERLTRSAERRREFFLLLPASVVVIVALTLSYMAQSGRLEDIDAQIASGKVLLLTSDTSREALTKQLRILDLPQDREFAARHISRVLDTAGRLPNVGALGRAQIASKDIAGDRSIVDAPKRLEVARERAEERERQRLARQGRLGRFRDWIDERFRDKTKPEVRVSVLSPQQLTALKPMVAVRTLAEYRRSFLIWSVLMVLVFYVTHLVWRIRGFGGDNTILPMVHVLTGIGLALMVSLRDPVRDSLLFRDFSIGVASGCVLMVLLSQMDYEQMLRRYTYLPLAAALLLAMLLFAFGSGPAGSDAKVNLFGFQPVELIRVLLVMFLAGYFGRNWDALRELRAQGGPLSWLARALHIARYDYALPVFAGVAVSLILFYALKDMGPALVIGCVFLALYSLARGSYRLAAFGLMMILGGFLLGYWAGEPETVRQRTDMWLNIWDNHVRGGDQIAHSLWSFSSGALTGTGLGLGYPQSVPAGHTDLILSVLSEQIGFIGFATVLLFYVLLFARCFRIALRSQGAYSSFLAAGLTLITAVQFVIIGGGILGLAPLSGVVTPFLSYGRSSMLINFAIVGVLLAISGHPSKEQAASPFVQPLRQMEKLLALAALVMACTAAWYQIAKADDTLLRGSLVVNADGVRRYEYNPRIFAAARMIPKGDIVDRDGLPLATSDLAKIEAHRKEYEALGVNLSETTHFMDRRHYPLGPAMFYVLGDTRSPLKRGARNAAFEETQSRLRLQGFDDGIEVEEERGDDGEIIRRLKFDYKDLLPLIRHRWEKDHPAVKELLARPRDVKMTIDTKLQMRTAQILQRALLKQKKERGAIVIMDAESGDLLASVSYPWPSLSERQTVGEELLLDRARYGLYPPGSSFKVVTAVAALRKNPALLEQKHDCIRLPDGRVGNTIKGQRRPIRDDVMDRVPHGSIAMEQALVVSCNAYFSQLGSYDVGAEALHETASIFGIATARPNTVKELRQSLHQASYGQGEVVVTPFQMARVAATIANGGEMPYGRWVMDDSNARTAEPRRVLPEDLNAKLAGAMRNVVTRGTGRSANVPGLEIAGKTGTAELAKKPSHAWFIGFSKGHAFAVLIENGQYGGRAAAPVAAEIAAEFKK